MQSASLASKPKCKPAKDSASFQDDPNHDAQTFCPFSQPDRDKSRGHPKSCLLLEALLQGELTPQNSCPERARTHRIISLLKSAIGRLGVVESFIEQTPVLEAMGTTIPRF